MSKTMTGVVKKTYTKEWEDDETGDVLELHSFQIEGDKRYFRTGENPLPAEEGDYIQFDVNPKGNNVYINSVEVLEDEPPRRAPPARRGKSSASRGRSFGGSRGNSRDRESASSTATSRDDYWGRKEKRDIEVIEPRITYAAAAHDATALVCAALAHDALSFGNAAKGKRLDMLEDFINEVAARFYEHRMNPENYLPQPKKKASRKVVDDLPEDDFDDEEDFDDE